MLNDQNKMTLDQVFEKLELIDDKGFLEECFNAIRDNEVSSSNCIIQERGKLASLYKLRLNMKIELQSDLFSVEELECWGVAVNTLNEFDSEMVVFNVVYTNEKGFLLFWSKDTLELISSFWLLQRERI